MGHFSLHRASGRARFRSIATVQRALGPGQGGRSLRPRHPRAPDSKGSRCCTGCGSPVLRRRERHC